MKAPNDASGLCRDVFEQLKPLAESGLVCFRQVMGHLMKVLGLLANHPLVTTNHLKTSLGSLEHTTITEPEDNKPPGRSGQPPTRGHIYKSPPGTSENNTDLPTY